jgi:tetratricopeptide (TPR) repeat protein
MAGKLGALRYMCAGKPGYAKAIKHLKESDHQYVEEILRTVYDTQGKDVATQLGEILEKGTEHVDSSAQRYAIDKLSARISSPDIGIYARAISVACEKLAPTCHKEAITKVFEYSNPLEYAQCITKVASYVKNTDHAEMLHELTDFIGGQILGKETPYQDVITYLDSTVKLMERIANPNLNMEILKRFTKHAQESRSLDTAIKYLDNFREALPKDAKIKTDKDLDSHINDLKYVSVGKPGYSEAIKYLKESDHQYVEEKLRTVYDTQGETAAIWLGKLFKKGTAHVDSSAQRYAIDKISAHVSSPNIDIYASAISGTCKKLDTTCHKEAITNVFKQDHPTQYAHCITKMASYVKNTDHAEMLHEVAKFIERQVEKETPYQDVITYLDSAIKLMDRIDNPNLNMQILKRSMDFAAVSSISLDTAVQYLDHFRKSLPTDVEIKTEDDLRLYISNYLMNTLVREGKKKAGDLLNNLFKKFKKS